MRHLCILAIALLLLAGSAAALDPVNVELTSSSQWITANNIDSATLTITVYDGAKKAIKDASIQLSVTDPWRLQDTTGVTPAGGQFTTKFLPTTTAGTAIITATVMAPGAAAPVVLTTSQNITAADPARSTKSYESAGSVGSITDITIRVTDQFGNPVTSRKKKNLVSFTTTLTGDNAFLVPVDEKKVRVKGVSIALNDSGYAEVDFALKTRPGENYVVIAPPFPLPATLISIRSLADLPPASISKTISPPGSPPTVRSDNSSKFTINYVLSDQYGNPSTNRNLSISASSGESRVVASNNEGRVTVTYGPKTQAGRYIITARALDDPSVVSVQTVQFLSGRPVNMLVTANPQSLASLEVNPSASSRVMAKVVDGMGNPVAGETVSFSILSVSTGSYLQTQGPSVQGDKLKTTNTNEVTAVTDDSGYAIGTFTPGTFVSDSNNPHFSLMAEGTAQVQARWSGVTRTINLSYKNFPYLSVSTAVDPATLATNESVRVSVQVKGDGYALKPKPVDAYMVTDRSGSMQTVDAGNYLSRMELVRNAAMSFKDKFDYSVDQLGQFSFGDDRYFYDDVTLDLGLSKDPGAIGRAISSLTPSGHTPMRYALYQAITALKQDKNADSVKGIVILSDGDFNYYGDPLARGSPGFTWVCDAWRSDGSCRRGHNDPWPSDWYDTGTWSYHNFTDLSPEDQNMATYARRSNIRIYAIGYSNSLTTDGQKTLSILANTTNGKYYYAMSQDDLINFYAQIAGALKDTAGVNTTLSLDFSKVDVNGVPNATSAALQYVYIDGESTRVTMPNRTSVTMDSTADWNKGRINVTMGTIKVNESWMANLTLRVLTSGNIKLLGSSSRVYFRDINGIEGGVSPPDTYVTAIPNGTDKGLGVPTFVISNLRRTNDAKDRQTAALQWDITYLNGKDPDITQEIRVAPLNSEFYSYRGTTNASSEDTTDSYRIDISDLDPGNYKVRVTGYVDDAGSSFNITQLTIPLSSSKPEIIIH